MQRECDLKRKAARQALAVKYNPFHYPCWTVTVGSITAASRLAPLSTGHSSPQLHFSHRYTPTPSLVSTRLRRSACSDPPRPSIILHISTSPITSLPLPQQGACCSSTSLPGMSLYPQTVDSHSILRMEVHASFLTIPLQSLSRHSLYLSTFDTSSPSIPLHLLYLFILRTSPPSKPPPLPLQFTPPHPLSNHHSPTTSPPSLTRHDTTSSSIHPSVSYLPSTQQSSLHSAALSPLLLKENADSRVRRITPTCNFATDRAVKLLIPAVIFVSFQSPSRAAISLTVSRLLFWLDKTPNARLYRR